MKIKLTYTLAAVAFFMMSHASAQQTVQITPSGIGYLQYLPQGYSSNTNKYPIVISLHGIKEKGTSSTDPALVKAGVPKVANVGLPKYVKYGQQYPFILISPQLKSSYGGWTGDYVMEVLNYVKTKLRVDPKRIYLTGLSLGGFGVWKTAVAYPEVFAAILPICSGGNAVSQACNIAKENIPTWAFHGDKDYTVSYQVSVKMVNAINACTPKPSPLAKVTLFPGMGHVIWDKVYKETSALTWLQSFTNGSVTSGTETPTTDNVAPVVSAGSDKTITLPTNTIYLNGSASDSDGSISSYLWTKIAGGTASLSGTTSSTLKAYNLVAGTYTFRLTVKDNDGTSKYDDVKVTVNSTVVTGNIPPVANAGSDKTLSTYTTKVYGSGIDSDGVVKYYKWQKVSGPGCYMYGVSKPTLELSKMTKGTYYFDLVVTDDKGAIGKDQVKIVIGG
jgi:hypothetical protein